jgi:hypothetical protein
MQDRTAQARSGSSQGLVHGASFGGNLSRRPSNLFRQTQQRPCKKPDHLLLKQNMAAGSRSAAEVARSSTLISPSAAKTTVLILMESAIATTQIRCFELILIKIQPFVFGLEVHSVLSWPPSVFREWLAVKPRVSTLTHVTTKAFSTA